MTKVAYPPLWPAAVEARVRAEARNLDPQKVPEHVQMCKTCVVSNQRPRITFDADGICSACRYWIRKSTSIDWADRESQLRTLLDKHRRSSGYDVIVPASGGKDSSMVAHRLKHEYGMHPLLVKWGPFIYTDIGRKNWDAIGQRYDTIEARPNGLLHRRLSRLSLEFLGDNFDPFVFGQLAFPMRMADMLGVSLVFGAENGELEYGGDASCDKPRWERDDWERVYLKGDNVTRLLCLGGNTGALSEKEINEASAFYFIPNLEGSVEYHHLGYYLPHWPMDNFYQAQEHCGFEPDSERSEMTYTRFASLDDKTDWLHYRMAYIKFGIGRCTSDAAQQVRAGDIDRDEALALVARYDGEVPSRHVDETLDYLGMDRAQLDRVIERFRMAA